MPAAEVGIAPPRQLSAEVGTIFVLLPVHNRRAVTETFVRCLMAQRDRAFHLVLVDDGSTDGTAQAVAALLPEATILRGTGSWWWAGSLQQAYDWLRQRQLGSADLVLIANDDTVFGPDFLASARAAMRSRRLLLAQLFNQDSGEFVELGVHVDWRRLKLTGVKDQGRVNCFSTRGLFLLAREFVELGGFHPRVLPHYLSDYEFTIRARRSGFELCSDPGVLLWYNPATTGFRHHRHTSGRQYLSQALSKRSVSNPVYWTTFLLLACPRRYLARNLVRVWRQFARGFIRSVREGADN